MDIGAHDKAETLREVARDLLGQADALDGEMPCECGHILVCHDPAGWNKGWCNGTLTTRRGASADKVVASDGDCKCEEFKAW